MFNRLITTLSLIVGLMVFANPVLAQENLKAVATFSILGDFVRQIGGDRVEVSSLVGPNGDAHVFSPTPDDAKTVLEAKVVFVNGLGLEGWLERLVKASGTKALKIVTTKGIKTMKGEGEEAGGGLDPHSWQDVRSAKIYAANIRDGLIEVDPAGRAIYEANAAAYIAKLDALDGEVRAAIAAIPKKNRRIITTHDAFGYFAKAYGMEFIAPLGVSTETEASARDVARIIQQVKAERVPAVFLENISDNRLMQRIANESGAKIGGRLYSDALSEPDGPAGTYIEMIRNNVKAFIAALTS
jgi:zinc/manganese transport system substrate-binding protein